MFIKEKLFLTFLVLALASVAAVGLIVEQTSAITTRILPSTIQTTRYRVTVADVAAATSPDVSGALREITLFTMAGGDQILSWVSNVSTAFTIPSGQRVTVVSIRARRSGVDVSPCDPAFPPDLSFANFEHRLGNCLEYAFYDEDLPTDIVVSFQSGDGSDLAGLTAGQVDFIVTKIQ